MSANINQRRGLMLVLSSPSGAGKTTLSRRCWQTDPDIVMSVSATTRAPRPSEVDGKDYFFISPEKFDAMAEGRRIPGTCHRVWQQVRHAQGACHGGAGGGKDVLFDIDWQGTQQLKMQAREDLVSVFVVPPTKTSWSGGCASAPRIPKTWSGRAWPRPMTRSATGRNMIMS